jgi:hypothetical protein
MTDKVPEDAAMTRSGRLLAKLAKLDRELAECRDDLQATEMQLEHYERWRREEGDSGRQLRVVQEFVDDWRLGIRDFSEWPDILAREGLQPFVPMDRV